MNSVMIAIITPNQALPEDSDCSGVGTFGVLFGGTYVGLGLLVVVVKRSPMAISAHARNSSCGPQPTAPVPFAHVPQLLPAIYFHCSTQ